MSIRHHYVDPDPSAWGNLSAMTEPDPVPPITAVERQYLDEALRHARRICPDGDPDHDWYTPNEVRLIVLAQEVQRLTTRPHA